MEREKETALESCKSGKKALVTITRNDGAQSKYQRQIIPSLPTDCYERQLSLSLLLLFSVWSDRILLHIKILQHLDWMVPLINPGNWKCELITSISPLLFPLQSICVFSNSFKIRLDQASEKNKRKLKRHVVVITVTSIASALLWRNTELSIEFRMTDFHIGERTKRYKARLARIPSDKVRQMEFCKSRISRPCTSTRKTRPSWHFFLFSKSCKNFCRTLFPLASFVCSQDRSHPWCWIVTKSRMDLFRFSIFGHV